ncbi:MAG: MFS transporter, partial [Terriglobales bacterium]
MLLLCAADLMVYVAIFSVPPIIGDLARHYHVSYAEAGILMAAYSVVRTAGSLAAGAVSDRFGVKYLALAGLGLVAAAGYGSAGASSFAALVVFRVLIGIGATIVFIPGLAAAIHLMPPQRVNLASGMFISSLYMGMSVALLATPVLAAGFGWPFPLKVFAGVTVAVGAVFIVL